MSSRSRGGFTLLEVLAATVIMAMFYGVLSAKGVEGFVLEGDADRRLRASLVADRVLADLETSVALGLPPELGVVEDAKDEFTIRVETAPLELPLEELLPEDAAAEDDGGPSLLAGDASQRPALTTVRVTVAWSDGLSEHRVKRTTFVLDPEVAATALGAAGIEIGAGGVVPLDGQAAGERAP